MWLPDVKQLKSPISMAIARSLADAIAAGKVAPGDRLPTRRELAYRLQVSLRTVTKAFALAHDRGLIVSQIGRGTFAVRFPEEAIESAGQRTELIDLATNSSVIDPFNSSLAHVFGSISRRKSLHSLLEYQPSIDIQQHHVAAARWIALRRVAVQPQDIVICHTLWEAHITLLSWIRSRNQFVMTSNLSSPGVRQASDLYALNLLGVRSDAEGLLPSDMLRLGRRYPVGAIFCSSTVDNPTSTTMSMERRHEIVDVAKRLGALIIEDDTYGHLAGCPLPTLTELAPERSIYLCGVHNSIAPGLRVAFIGWNSSLRDQISPITREMRWRSSTLMGEIASILINDGVAERLLAWHRKTAVERQQLATHILGLERPPPLPAYFMWYPLPGSWNSEEFVARVASRGVSILPAQDFAVEPSDAPAAVRICLGAVRQKSRLADGLRIIAEAVRST